MLTQGPSWSCSGLLKETDVHSLDADERAKACTIAQRGTGLEFGIELA